MKEAARGGTLWTHHRSPIIGQQLFLPYKLSEGISPAYGIHLRYFFPKAHDVFGDTGNKLVVYQPIAGKGIVAVQQIAGHLIAPRGRCRSNISLIALRQSLVLVSCPE